MHVRRVVLEIGVHDRRVLPARLAERRADRGTLAAVAVVIEDAHGSGQERARSSSRVPPIEPSSTISSSNVPPRSARQHLIERRLDRRPLVVDGHDDRDLGCGGDHASRRSTISSSVPHMSSDHFRVPVAYGLLAALFTVIDDDPVAPTCRLESDRPPAGERRHRDGQRCEDGRSGFRVVGAGCLRR